MKPNTYIADSNYTVQDVVTPASGVFPMASLNRAETFSGMAFDSSSNLTTIMSERSFADLETPRRMTITGGLTRQASMQLYAKYDSYDTTTY